MVDELSKQKDIKPVVCASCVCSSRLAARCLSAEKRPSCRATSPRSQQATQHLTRTKSHEEGASNESDEVERVRGRPSEASVIFEECSSVVLTCVL